jgi:kynurenine formamidase
VVLEQLRSGEHTGTHFDAPNHWVTGQGGLDVAGVPVAHLIRPAVVLDFSASCAKNPDFLLEVDDITAWRRSTHPCRTAGGCSTERGGTRGRTPRSGSSTPTRPARTRPA